jgi:ATP-dependent DNA helicase RecQ
MKDAALQMLRKALANPAADFRAGQWECIEGILRSQRQLVVQKTGWGKSMVYFLGTRLLRDQGKGLTLLVSPLLSLMRNQIMAANRIGILAETINSSNTDDWQAIEGRLLANKVDILLISPERLANDDFLERVLQQVANRVGLFVVDEVHCISDWGHDFRLDYQRVVGVLQVLPKNIPILATTATANDRVVRDVAHQLGALNVVRGPLIRETLALQNIWLPNPPARMAWLAEYLKDLPGSGIIYTLTVRDSERVTEWLKANEYNVEAYHSKIDSEAEEQGAENEKHRREQLEHRLLNNDVKALVATVALGMGFDKPDLGFVVHFQRPGSVVHYYQQVGRAGRAMDYAYGILMGGEEDKEITDFFIRSAFPPQAHVDKILGALNAADGGLSVPMMQKQLNLSYGDIQKCLKLLAVETPSPVAKIKSAWHATPVNYQMDHEKIRGLCELRQAEQTQMIDYMKTKECLMVFLGRALDDKTVRECGKCANCLRRDLMPTTVNTDLANRAAIFLKRSYQPIEPRKKWPAKDIFEHYPFKGSAIGADIMAEQGRALSLWGDAGWGHMVREDKDKVGKFRDDLVNGCLQMLEAWQPASSPVWMTSIPSLTHPDLVPDFARRLAARIGIPFVPCLKKVRQNEQQKRMQNSFQQAKNLDGVFKVDSTDMPVGPVLLVDDMVDSRWTFTVATALLRQAGCPAALPLALALNSPRTD